MSKRLIASGRVQSIRTAGSKLVFMDLKDGQGNTIQVVSQYGKLEANGVSRDRFRSYMKTARKGDWYTVTGHAHRTARGEPSIMAVQLPQLVSPSLHQIPVKLDDPETRARHPHVDMLVNQETVQTLRLRHFVERHLAGSLEDDDFIHIRTPILTAGAGGAVARPFETEATELLGQKLTLRIAPELWLKRLVVGGLDRVYEIGPAFRNEGVDATHNPEFTICEFYQAFATLDDLMDRTQHMLRALQKELQRRKMEQGEFSALSLPTDVSFEAPFPVLDFIPTIERELDRSLPDLSAPDAQEKLVEIFGEKNLALPAKPTLPRLLDALAGHCLEPLCQAPTFITNHPACLSPLSKHFVCTATGQIVAARAELFIKGREYANMYEEENSPFEQRRKLTEQLKFRELDGESDGCVDVDESYLECLEWGLPPTGGWGCGVDRLVMLFSGRERMNDVLAFGSLRNVVGLGRGRG